MPSRADTVRRAGTGPDRNLVHLSDREMDLLARAWGPPETNPNTGLPAYGIFDDVLGAIGGVVGAIPVVGQIAGPLFGLAQSLLGGPELQPGVRNQQTGAYDMYAPTGANYKDQSNFWERPGGISDFAGGVLGFLGNMAASREREKQQRRLQNQQNQRYQDFIGPNVDYGFDQPTTETIGLAPSGPVELAGLRPEDRLTETRPLPYAAGGGVPGWRNMNYDPTPRAPLAIWRNMQASQPRSRGNVPEERPIMRARGRTAGPGGGQDDLVPAYLSPDEYVLPADVVSHFGDGSSTEGARQLDDLVAAARKRRTGNDRFPPKASGVLASFARRAA